MSVFFSKLFAIFLSKIAKNAVFALYCEISIAEVRLLFNLVRKCLSANAELRCASTESKSSMQKLHCVSEIKKINSVFCAALLLVEKIVALLMLRYLSPALVDILSMLAMCLTFP